jgi:hypothetical protein
MSEVNAAFIVAAPPVPALGAAPAAPAQAPAAAPAAAAAPAVVDPNAAAPAAAPAPVAFTVDPPAAAPTPPGNEIVVYEKTGDVGLDVALQYVGQRGFKPDHPAMQAVSKGDFSLIEAELAKLGDKASDAKDYIALAKESLSRRTEATKAVTEKTTKAVYDAVGGAENWTAIQAWAQANADPDEKAQLNAAFKAGPLVAGAAARSLAELYQKHGKTEAKPVVKDTATNVASVTDGPLSPRDFAKAVSQLHGKIGARIDDSAEYKALVARRRAYKG